MDDFEKRLRDAGKGTSQEYPRDLYTATKAEYVTMARKAKKKPGCPLMGGIILLILVSVLNILF